MDKAAPGECYQTFRIQHMGIQSFLFGVLPITPFFQSFGFSAAPALTCLWFLIVIFPLSRKSTNLRFLYTNNHSEDTPLWLFRLLRNKWFPESIKKPLDTQYTSGNLLDPELTGYCEENLFRIPSKFLDENYHMDFTIMEELFSFFYRMIQKLSFQPILW